MRTPKQIAASRANGALSKGPVTIQGKLNSSRNSLRHGLLARTVVLAEESTDRFLELLRALLEEFNPASTTQLMLVETMAVARWRQLRIWGMHKVVMDREIALQDPGLGTPEVRAALSFKANSDSVQPDLMLRYDIALDRQFTRALARLTDLQSRPAPKNAVPFFPESMASHTWRDSPEGREDGPGPQRREDGTESASSPDPDSDLAVLRAPKNGPQRRDPEPVGSSSAGTRSDLAVLRVPEDATTKRTQQPIESTRPPDEVE